ncbi:MAG: AraC family transcriptional regulator [Eubacteriales bacterium]|nr:AraC family transcriptional regulator [Eubacteriales bacterium]
MRLVRDNIPLEKEFPFKISQVVLDHGNSDPDVFHWHSYFEITYVEKGSGNYFVNGQEYTMDEGDIIIFNNVEPHGWKLLGQDMHLLVMVFSPEFVAEKLSVFDSEYLKPFVERGSNFKNRIGKEEPVSHEICESIREIYEEWEVRKEGYPLMIKANILRILTMLIRTYQDESKSGEMLKEKKNAMKRLEQAFAYIDTHYCDKITLDEVAASAYMSSNYFSSYFRKVTNISFSDYVTRLRIMHARELLRDTDKSVMEIAMGCGFNNISNFYRLYKKHVGKSPREDKK